jgi:hypothetical protein
MKEEITMKEWIGGVATEYFDRNDTNLDHGSETVALDLGTT